MSLLMEALKKAEQAKKKALLDQKAANQDSVFTLVDSEYARQNQSDNGDSELFEDASEAVSELDINQDALELELEKMLDKETSEVGVNLEKIEEVATGVSELSAFDNDDSQQYTSKYDESHSFALLDLDENAKPSEIPCAPEDNSDSLIQDLSFELDGLAPIPEAPEKKVANVEGNIETSIPVLDELSLTDGSIEKLSKIDIDEEKTAPVLQPNIQKKFEEIKARELTPKEVDETDKKVIKKRKRPSSKIVKKVTKPDVSRAADSDISFETKISIKEKRKGIKFRLPKKMPTRGTAIKLGLLASVIAVASGGYVYVNGELQGYSAVAAHPSSIPQPLSESGVGFSPVVAASEGFPIEGEAAVIAPKMNDIGSNLTAKAIVAVPVKGVVAKKIEVAAKKRVVTKPVKTDKREVRSVIPPANRKPTSRSTKIAALPPKKTRVKAKEIIKTGQLSVLNTQPVDKTYQLLIEAYKDLNVGEYESAKTKYTKVLQSGEYDRDALLGLAAIAISQNSNNVAQAYYSRLLQQNKQDSAALAGLVDLVSKMDPLAAESQLKTLLSQESGAAHLHFALGNAYVAQERWADAQSSFFNAFNIDRGSADYAYNLAVSLDMLGESAEAANFYNKAITLSAQRRSLFNQDSVVERLRLLNNILGAG